MSDTPPPEPTTPPSSPEPGTHENAPFPMHLIPVEMGPVMIRLRSDVKGINVGGNDAALKRLDEMCRDILSMAGQWAAICYLLLLAGLKTGTNIKKELGAALVGIGAMSNDLFEMMTRVAEGKTATPSLVVASEVPPTPEEPRRG